MFAILKRELGAYFYSPIAYALFTMFALIAGYFFYSAMSIYGLYSMNMSQMAQFMGPQELSVEEDLLRVLFANLSVVLLLLAPIITMRLFAEEKKSGSIEMLFTWPVTDGQTVAAKYFAALLVFSAMLALTTPGVGFIALHAPVPWGNVFAGYMGLFLLGASFIALGIFVSTLTENQVIAGAATFGSLLLFWLIGWSAADDGSTLSAILKFLSLIEHFDPFTKGVIDSADVIYYLSFVTLFLFLTLRSLESKGWRGVR